MAIKQISTKQEFIFCIKSQLTLTYNFKEQLPRIDRLNSQNEMLLLQNYNRGKRLLLLSSLW